MLLSIERANTNTIENNIVVKGTLKSRGNTVEYGKRLKRWSIAPTPITIPSIPARIASKKLSKTISLTVSELENPKLFKIANS